MGKKAKKRAKRKESPLELGTERFLEVEAHETIMRYVDDPDFETIWMDPSIPLFVFMNKKTNEVASLGDIEAVMESRDAWARAVAETTREFKEKARLN
tara:strand:+ start:599 stop:892 length:294 start_codon:yes stop_codon:yes gene_type:complete